MEYIIIQEEQSLLDLSSKEHDLFFSEERFIKVHQVASNGVTDSLHFA